tara:strand:- start:204378 stop:205301 length:924 start_codon:yes stop_codon:yes gene_type:complete
MSKSKTCHPGLYLWHDVSASLGMKITEITRDSIDVHALRKGAGHKYEHGHALVVCGGPGQTGAARLAARGALRIGAGAVSLAVSPSAQMEVAGHVTAVMLRRVTDGRALHELLQDARINAVCIGPGMGMSAREAALVRCVLDSGAATVLDADALTLLAQDAALFALLHKGCVLTPHAGEFTRLFPTLAARWADDPAYSKLHAARDAAQLAGCTVLLKGVETVIAAPSGMCSIHHATGDRAVPWLATAGAGDVLSGFITGLLARGWSAVAAARTATWLHVESARQFGPGLIAEDLPDGLPQVLRQLGV